MECFLKYISDLNKSDIQPGMKVLSYADVPGIISRITVQGEIVQYPKTYFAIIEWDNSKCSFLNMNDLKIYNKIKVVE